MMDKELIEKIAELLTPLDKNEHPIWYEKFRSLAVKILDLIRSAGYVQQWGECPLCKGTGKQGAIENGYTSEWKCPTCHGTGQGEKLLFTREDIRGILREIDEISYEPCPYQSCYKNLTADECFNGRRMTENCDWWQSFKERYKK